MKADLVVEGFVQKQIFPTYAIKNAGEFAIFSFSISKILYGDVDERVKNKWYKEGFVTLKGSVPELNGSTKYRISADLVSDPKYGYGYQIKLMNVCADFTTEDGVRKFLSYVVTENQARAIIEGVEDPISVLESKDIETLCSIKGVGRTTAERILEKYENSRDNSNAYSVLYDYGLTKHMIDKLVLQYKSPDTLVSKIRSNPYILIDECDGIGWSKADGMALRYGIPYDSDFRIRAYIKYFFKNLAETDGHTWVPLDVLVSNIRGLITGIKNDRLSALLKDMVSSNILYYKRETKQIGLYVYRKLEESICEELLRIRDAEPLKKIEHIEETIKECEETVGFEYTDEQITAIKAMCEKNLVLLSANAGCVDANTEYFNGEKWKKISEYSEGENVLQYNPETKTSHLVPPERYIKQPCEEFWLLKTRNMEQCVSDDHMMYYFDGQNEPHLERADSFISKLLSSKDKESYYFPTSFYHNGRGIDLADNEIKIMCAVICEGSFCNNMKNRVNARASTRCRFHIKKDCKKETLRRLFNESGIWWREKESAVNGYTDFYIDAPRREKEFTSYWYNCSQEQLKIICDNIIFWGGHKCKNNSINFLSSSKKTANFVQFAFSATGRTAKRYVYNRNWKTHTKKCVGYKVNITNSQIANFPNVLSPGSEITKIKSEDGFKYCFTMPSGYFILRRNGKISCMKQCGKSSLMYPVTRIFRKNGISFAQCTLSGKASLNLREITSEAGQTIHKLLKWQDGKFVFNKECKLSCGAVILDEISMVGGVLFYQLIQAISSGSKLIMIGDPGQLESIGLCNLISDISASKSVEHVHLSKIFRQAAMSGIITDSLKVYNQKPIISKKFIGHEVHGELKDFDLYIGIDKNACMKNIMNIFNNLHFEQSIGISDIIVVTAKRCSGGLSASEINQKIQETIKFEYGPTITKEYKDGNTKYEVTYHVGDRVLVTENDYNTENYRTGEKEAIFNGNIGTILSIESTGKEMVVRFPQGDIVIGRGKLSSIQLGYAITTHKSQGSGFKYVIAVADPGAYMLLTKEFLYTAITRAKKHCYLIGTPSSVDRCVNTTRVIKKQTWLKDLLSGEDTDFHL